MSDYEYSTATARPSVDPRERYRDVCAQLGNVALDAASANVPRMATEGLSARDLLAASARAMRSDTAGLELAQREIPSLINGLQVKGGSVFSGQVRTRLERVGDLLQSGSRPDLLKETASALQTASREVARAERRYYSLAIEDALLDLGYSVTRVEGATAAAVEATRGHEVRVLGVSTAADGSVELVRDGAGLSGDACHEADAKLVESLAKRGIVLEKVRSSRRHGDAKGGALIRELAPRVRSGGSGFAQAYVDRGDEERAAPASSAKARSEKSKGLYKKRAVSKGKVAHRG